MISLRKLEPSDLPYLYRWENDASSSAVGSIHNPLSQQDLRDYIASTTGDCYLDKQLRLMIVDDDETEGCVDIYDLDIRNRKAAVGIYIAPDYRGRGVGRAAMRLLHEIAFGQLALEMLYAFVSVDNAPSSALFASLGYTPSSPIAHWTLESDAVLWQLVRS